MIKKLKRVEIIAPVHNRRDLTLKCLRSLGRIDRSGLDVHIIIVDDGSTDGTAEAIRQQFPDVEVLRGDGSLWYTEGTNVGFRAALKHHPDYVLAINDDTVFDEHFLKRLVTTAESNPRSIVGPLLLLWDTPHKLFQTAPVWDTWVGGIRHWRHQTVWTLPDRAWSVDLIVGNCVLYPVQAIRECGLMNSGKFKMYGDCEYTPRMKRNGWQLLVEPSARVFCKPNDQLTGFRKMPTTKKLREAFLNPYGPYHVGRRIRMNFGNAPNRFQALISLPIFYARAALGINVEGKWAENQNEEPLVNTVRTTV